MSNRVPQAELDALREGLTTVAITGTNGKTTTTSMVAAIAEAAGQVPVRVTTLGMWVGDEQLAHDGSMPSFVRTLRRAREVGAETLALEVTSRALAAGFATRFPADIAVFTNLSQDHLDRHGTPERYLAAKAQLFAGPKPPRVAVLNRADPAAELLAEIMPASVERHGYQPRPDRQTESGIPITLGLAKLDSGEAHESGAGPGGLHLELSDSALAAQLDHQLQLGVLGAFNADNALAAAVAAHVAGFPARAIRAGLAGFRGVPGRFERVAEAPLALVDFAHSPDALCRVLEAARGLARARDGRVACVFGCGGERDQDKRAPMGAVADRLADAVWLTTDNPRGEDPVAIAAMVMAAVAPRAEWHDEPDRRRAIASAVQWARAADVVVVAGRGHETMQIFADGPRPFSDADVLAQACRERSA